MRNHFRPGRLAWPAAALAAGLMLGGYWPHAPLHAVATDSNTVCAIATGQMDPSIEAVFVLDSVTGELRAGVLSKRTGQFRAQYGRKILNDFALAEGGKPQFLMVTGVSDLVSGMTVVRPSVAVVYVAEVSTGVIRAYGVPWDATAHSRDNPVVAPLAALGIWKYRTAPIREK